MNKTEQTTSPIFYDPTPANAGPVWAWHAAPEWEVHTQLLDLTPWGSATQCPDVNPAYWLKGVEVAEDILMDRVHRNMKP